MMLEKMTQLKSALTESLETAKEVAAKGVKIARESHINDAVAGGILNVKDMLPKSTQAAKENIQQQPLSPTPLTKKQLLNRINELEKNPKDRIRLLGDVGVTTMGAIAGGIVASAIFATKVAVLTAVGSFFGLKITGSAPGGLVFGGVIAGAAIIYGVSRLIHSGGMSEQRQKELLKIYRERIQKMEEQERAAQVTDTDRDQLVISMRELVKHDLIHPELAAKLIKAVKTGKMPVSRAYQHFANIIQHA
jgi:hypothetical protein